MKATGKSLLLFAAVAFAVAADCEPGADGQCTAGLPEEAERAAQMFGDEDVAASLSLLQAHVSHNRSMKAVDGNTATGTKAQAPALTTKVASLDSSGTVVAQNQLAGTFQNDYCNGQTSFTTVTEANAYCADSCKNDFHHNEPFCDALCNEAFQSFPDNDFSPSDPFCLEFDALIDAHFDNKAVTLAFENSAFASNDQTKHALLNRRPGESFIRRDRVAAMDKSLRDKIYL